MKRNNVDESKIKSFIIPIITKINEAILISTFKTIKALAFLIIKGT